MSKFHSAGGGIYNLSGSISSTATSITLSSFLVPVSDAQITMVLMDTDIAYGTIAPKTSNSEFISFTGITENVDGTSTLTGVTRGLNKTSPYTSSSTFKTPHAGQTQFILSDAPQVFEKYVSLENAETITGLKTFPAGGNASAPVSGASYTAPTNDLEYASKKYVDDIAIAGAPDASTTVKGIVEEATQAEVDAGTAAGGTSARLFINPSTHRGRAYNDYAADSVGTDAYAITISPAITAYVTGQVFVFKAGTANTGAATLAVSGLAAKAIVKNFNAALETGDIRAGQVVTVVYESVGDNFQLQTSELVHIHEAATSGGQLNATNVFSAGTVPTARLGSGTADSSTFLRGDQTYTTIPTPAVFVPVATTQVLTGGQSATYADIDLSSIVGANAALVILSGSIAADTGSALSVRRNGSAVDYPGTTFTSTGAFGSSTLAAADGNTALGVLIVPTDTSGIIEYKVSGTNPSGNLYVLGYIK